MSGPFFTSRWVQRPDHVTELEPTLLPQRFRAAGVTAGLKRPESLDLGVLVSDSPETVSAARFTTNARVGAPVIASREADTIALRAIVANSGGSNTGDGQRGLDTARLTQARAAEALGVESRHVGVASTGVIGSELPREPLLVGVGRAVAGLDEDAGDFAEAIRTSDRTAKRACLEVSLPSGTVRIAGQAKGAGMISPRFATMFCFVQTDAAVSADTLDLLTTVCVKRSFDRISVDGQLSTSDTVFVMANAAKGVGAEPESEDELRLGEAMDALMRQLALQIVADGEGTRRTGRVVVAGAEELIEPVARAIADSPLVKTALHGADPNFGRILQAAGAAFPRGQEFLVDLEIEGRQVVSAGEAILEDLRALEPLVTRDEVEFRVTLPGSGGETEVFFSDLSPAYVTFNSEYTS